MAFREQYHLSEITTMEAENDQCCSRWLGIIALPQMGLNMWVGPTKFSRIIKMPS